MNKQMIVGNPTKALIVFAIPMILGQLCQQIYSLADTVIVGRTLGAGPLGAVGSAVAICWVYVAIALGLGMGCSVVISQMYGAGQLGRMRTAINTSIIAMLSLSLIFLVIGLITCDAVTMAMTDEKVYNEVLDYVSSGNYSCYIDKPSEATHASLKTVTVPGTPTHAEEYSFKDDARLDDEVIYYAAGNMNGMTITFQPEGNGKQSEVIIADGIINKFIALGAKKNPKALSETTLTSGKDEAVVIKYLYGEPDTATTGTLGTMTEDGINHYLYQKVMSVVGQAVTLESQCYRNSEYTIFIHIKDTTREMSMNNAIQIYGQWNGTNLGAQH